ncbi:hypothetical protein [Arthrobacter sp. ISL-30]|uniref:hypothetical protein n=1 Tax=Arthrobacter sp. ISL-30 TaxID=2819109 RepID=UPI001BE5FDB4|nr:hypothetical protein [Arthrobacter sp. ISL-30]MBT2515244.1 hypothetical protein [Arthrobacter sp. ISL-30]
MSYFLEYTIPAAPGDAEFEFPYDEIRVGETIPLTETNAPRVHTPELSARTRIEGATVPEAKREAEELILHSRADAGSLYYDPSNSLNAGVGALVSIFTEGKGWADVPVSS